MLLDYPLHGQEYFPVSSKKKEKKGLICNKFPISCNNSCKLFNITDGRMEKGISKEGVQFYHDLIDELLKNGLICSHDLLHFSLSFQRSVTEKN